MIAGLHCGLPRPVALRFRARRSSTGQRLGPGAVQARVAFVFFFSESVIVGKNPCLLVNTPNLSAVTSAEFVNTHER